MRRRFVLLATLSAGALLAAPAEEREIPDLRLDWVLESEVSPDVPPVRGRAGETVRLVVRLRNLGGADAFAVILEAYTALGRTRPPRRLQPGPPAGGSMEHQEPLTLVPAMRTLCLVARLQRVLDEDPAEERVEDNQICREIHLEDAGSEPEGESAAHGPSGALSRSLRDEPIGVPSP